MSGRKILFAVVCALLFAARVFAQEREVAPLGRSNSKEASAVIELPGERNLRRVRQLTFGGKKPRPPSGATAGSLSFNQSATGAGLEEWGTAAGG